MVTGSPSPHPDSSRTLEVFNLENVTSVAGANLLVDFMRDHMQIQKHLSAFPFDKAPWSTYTLSDEIEALLCAYTLGYERISHIKELEADPLLCWKLGIPKLPDTTTLYRNLERFNSEDRVNALGRLNRYPLEYILRNQKIAILDIDTTVETVFGQQEGSCIGYNPRYHGRSSYQPFLAFEGLSRAAVHARLRSGTTPSAEEIVSFIKESISNLPPGVKVEYVRGDRGMTSESVCAYLESKDISYTLKMKMPSTLYSRISRGVLWRRLFNEDDNIVIEAGSIMYQATSWIKRRRIILVRWRPAFEQQQRLFEEYSWHYEAIITNLDWDAEDIWHFYNTRCACENCIKELKYGVNMDMISKARFWPNAADLWLKVIAYNILLALRSVSPSPYKSFSIKRFRRAFLRVPGLLVHHARKWILRLPAYWPHAPAWREIRLAICI